MPIPWHFISWMAKRSKYNAFQKSDVLAQLNANHTCVGKSPASTTHIYQPCNVGDCFRASKAALRGIHDKDVKYKSHLVEAIRKILLVTTGNMPQRRRYQSSTFVQRFLGMSSYSKSTAGSYINKYCVGIISEIWSLRSYN